MPSAPRWWRSWKWRAAASVRGPNFHDGAGVAHAALENAGGGRYRQVVSPPRSGQYTVAVTGVADGKPQRVSELVIVLPDDTR